MEKKENHIKGLDILGKWCEKPYILKVIVKDYFKQRLTYSTSLQIRFGKMEFHTISEQDNEKLTRMIKEEEIRVAILQCDGSRSLGPDGFYFGFIKKAMGNCK